MDFGVWLALVCLWKMLPWIQLFLGNFLSVRQFFFLPRGRWVLLPDGLHQGFLPSEGHRPVALVRDSVRLPKGDAPLEKKL